MADLSPEEYRAYAQDLSLRQDTPVLVMTGTGGTTARGRFLGPGEHIAGHSVSDKVWEYLQKKGRKFLVTHLYLKGKECIIDPPEPWTADFQAKSRARVRRSKG